METSKLCSTLRDTRGTSRASRSFAHRPAVHPWPTGDPPPVHRSSRANSHPDRRAERHPARGEDVVTKLPLQVTLTPDHRPQGRRSPRVGGPVWSRLPAEHDRSASLTSPGRRPAGRRRRHRPHPRPRNDVQAPIRPASISGRRRTSGDAPPETHQQRRTGIDPTSRFRFATARRTALDLGYSSTQLTAAPRPTTTEVPTASMQVRRRDVL